MGLSDLGVHLVERMMQRKMIIDPDHLSVLARQQLLDVVEKRALLRRRLQPQLEHARTRSRASCASAAS